MKKRAQKCGFYRNGSGGKGKGRKKNEYYNNKQGIRQRRTRAGKRLADIKGYDYYDSEIIAAVAKKSGMDEAYIENTLSNHGWRNQAITFRGTLASSAYVESSKVQLLLEQKEVITGIAQMGKDCVIVGRNADIILREYEPLNIFVCASAEAKPKRCRERAAKGGKPERKGAAAPDEKDRRRAPPDKRTDDRLAVGTKGRLSAYSKYNTMGDKAVGTGGCIFCRLLVWEKTMNRGLRRGNGDIGRAAGNAACTIVCGL